MNIERILKLADFIDEKTIPADSPLVSGDAKDLKVFDMSNYHADHPCGTAACIAGWAAHLSIAEGESPFETLRDADRNGPGVHSLASDYLGLSSRQSANLFFADPSDGEGYCPMLREVTPTMAAATLRHLAHSGEVVWAEEE